MRKLFALGAAVVLAASTAYAAPNVTNVSQKGSLLIFADIDVQYGRTTIIRMVNDGDSDVKVKCIYADQGNLDVSKIKYKNWSDFVLTLTPRQPVWFDAKTGFGSSGYGTANSFPSQLGRGGELVCFAITNTEQNKRKYNFLAGTATILDFYEGAAGEYSAHAFYMRSVSATPAELSLDGVEYDYCPEYLVGQFNPVGGYGVSLPYDGYYYNGFQVYSNRLAVASCTQEPRQDNVPTFTKLEFEVWNENEVKFTGAYRCVDSWWDTYLSDDDEMYNPQNFTWHQLGSDSAYYRVKGVASIRCSGSKAVGLIGVQTTWMHIWMYDYYGDYGFTANALHHAGTKAGLIKWDLGSVTEEGSVR